MSQPPQIRLVTRSQYALHLSKWLLRFELAILCSILGAGLLLLELFYLSLQFAIFCHAPIEVEQTPFDSPLALLIIPVGGVLVLAGRKLFARTGSNVPYAPITADNAHLLSPAESLVRSSSLPTQRRQAELLRAASGSSEIPQSQLLRASGPSPENENSH